LQTTLDAYSVKHILYNWKDGPANSVTIDPAVQLPQFIVRGFRAINRTEQLSTGLYTIMKLTKRSMAFTLLKLKVRYLRLVQVDQ
jgi:hypothetical protein